MEFRRGPKGIAKYDGSGCGRRTGFQQMLVGHQAFESRAESLDFVMPK